MKKRNMKKWAALLLSVLFCFSSLALSMGMRALAEEGNQTGESQTSNKPYDTISFTQTSFVYTGSDLSSEIKAAVSVASKRNPTFSFYKGSSASGNPVTSVVDAGEYTVVAYLAADHDYEVTTATDTIKITPATIDESMIGVIDDQIYTGNEIKPEPAVTFNGKTLLKDTDYVLSYRSNVDAGTGRLTVTGKGNFAGTGTSVGKNFTITPASIATATIADILPQQYTGSAIEPDPVVTFKGKTLKKGTDYNVTYDNNIEVGSSALVIVSGIGNFDNLETKHFTIKSSEKDLQVFYTDYAEARTKTYGDPDFDGSATLSIGDGAINYKSSDTSVATISEKTGTVTIKNAGTTTITATAAATETYAEASTSFVLTVEKADITVTAPDKTIHQGERAPVLSDLARDGDYSVEGLVGNDVLRGEAYMSYRKNGTAVTPDTSEPGSYDIAIEGFMVPSSNYNEIKYVMGTLTILRSSGESGGIGTPTIASEDGEIKGWDAVVSEVGSILDESYGEDGDQVEKPVVEIDMNGSTVIVKELLEAIRGENISVRLLYGSGVVWTIDGRDIDIIDEPNDTDLGVIYGGTTGADIPAEAIRKVLTKDSKYPVRISIEHDGKLGFAATLSFNVAKALGEAVTSRSRSRLYGMVANLYYYNPATGALEFETCGYIDEKGKVDFLLDHASEYVIVTDKSRLGGEADVMRVYNPNNGRHHLSTNWDEINFLIDHGWRYEGISFKANMYGSEDLAVYRLYDPNSGEHLFTASASEKGFLTGLGWIDEGICWYGVGTKKTSDNTPVFRYYNPNSADHHFTTSQDEASILVVAGWKNEGITFYVTKAD